MQNTNEHMYDIGDLKNHPVELYDLAVKFSQFFEGQPPLGTGPAEIWDVLQCVSASLWGNLPPVFVVDFRDPEDPSTWGEYGPPENAGNCM